MQLSMVAVPVEIFPVRVEVEVMLNKEVQVSGIPEKVAWDPLHISI